MGANDNRLIILKTALPDKCRDTLLNPWAMGEKGGQRAVKVRAVVRPEGLIGDATVDLFVMHDSQKPHNPSGGIIGFTGGKCYPHDITFFTRMTSYSSFRHGGTVTRIAQGQNLSA
jgi:hypothetical protein